MKAMNTAIENQGLTRAFGAGLLDGKSAVVFGAGGSIGAAVANRYLDGVAKQAGKIDIAVDLTGPLASEYGNGKIAVELPVDEFMASLTTIVKSHFITARGAARHMI